MKKAIIIGVIVFVTSSLVGAAVFNRARIGAALTHLLPKRTTAVVAAPVTPPPKKTSPYAAPELKGAKALYSEETLRKEAEKKRAAEAKAARERAAAEAKLARESGGSTSSFTGSDRSGDSTGELTLFQKGWRSIPKERALAIEFQVAEPTMVRVQVQADGDRFVNVYLVTAAELAWGQEQIKSETQWRNPYQQIRPLISLIKKNRVDTRQMVPAGSWAVVVENSDRNYTNEDMRAYIWVRAMGGSVGRGPSGAGLDGDKQATVDEATRAQEEAAKKRQESIAKRNEESDNTANFTASGLWSLENKGNTDWVTQEELDRIKEQREKVEEARRARLQR